MELRRWTTAHVRLVHLPPAPPLHYYTSMKHRRAILLASFGSSLLVIVLLFAHPRIVKSPLEVWIGSELQRIANRFINPELHFDKLVYHSPRTVILTNLTLTSPDPLDPAKSVTILSVKTARLELANI